MNAAYNESKTHHLSRARRFREPPPPTTTHIHTVPRLPPPGLHDFQIAGVEPLHLGWTQHGSGSGFTHSGEFSGARSAMRISRHFGSFRREPGQLSETVAPQHRSQP